MDSSNLGKHTTPRVPIIDDHFFRDEAFRVAVQTETLIGRVLNQIYISLRSNETLLLAIASHSYTKERRSAG